MALRKLKEKVLQLRQQGMSYSQIKAVVKVNKSTLSLWLRDLPLSDNRIKELRDFSAIRIEKCRNTKAEKKQSRLDAVYKKVSSDVGKLSNREIFLCGLFLYWGEGSKTNRYSVEITNTDPAMIKFVLLWFKTIGVYKESLIVHLKIYKDMNRLKILEYWSKLLNINKNQFRFHIKKSNQSDITYKGGFGRGTCSIVYWDRDKGEYITQCLSYFKNYFL